MKNYTSTTKMFHIILSKLLFWPLIIIASTSIRAQDTWIKKAQFAGHFRERATGFSIGSKGYIGTGRYPYSKDFWEYDPQTDNWTQKADFGGPVRAEASGFSIGNKGYIGLGTNESDYFKDFWEYDPESNTWTKKANFRGSARTGATGFAVGNKGYIGTGSALGGPVKDFWEYDPGTDFWVKKANFPGTARYYATGFSIGDKGYIGTGYDGNYKTDFWEYDTNTNTWTQKADVGYDNREGSVGFSINSKGYIGLGHGGSGYHQDFWEYDPTADSWLQKDDFDGDARDFAVGFSLNGKGYVGTGHHDGPVYKKDFWEYTPDLFPCFAPSTFSTTNITSISAIITWEAIPGAEAYQVRYKDSTSVSWIKKYALTNSTTLSNLSPEAKYKWSVRTICSRDPDTVSEWSPLILFATVPQRISDAESEKNEILIYPNPANQEFTLAVNLNGKEWIGTIQIFDMMGQKIYEEKIQAQAGIVHEKIDPGNISGGMYMIKIIAEGLVFSKPLIISNSKTFQN